MYNHFLEQLEYKPQLSYCDYKQANIIYKLPEETQLEN